tara:strand:- start:9 stop:449 length:441 start_codon:yes stop_codon:yes gene_type:complete
LGQSQYRRQTLLDKDQAGSYNMKKFLNQMSIKLALLKSGEQVLTDVKELTSEKNGKVFAYLFNDPVVVIENYVSQEPKILMEETEIGENGEKVEITMTSWIRLTKEKEMVVPLDWVITIVDPIDDIIKMYNSRGEKNDSMPPSQEY